MSKNDRYPSDRESTWESILSKMEMNNTTVEQSVLCIATGEDDAGFS